MYGYQGPPSWLQQGMQQVPPNVSMGHPGTSGPHVYPPGESADASLQSAEVEVDVEQQQHSPAPTEKGKNTKKCVSRTKLGNFNLEEDVNVVKSWLEISWDPITSTGQEKDHMWERILQRYNFRRGSNPERSVRSLQSRWDNVKAEVGKFAAFYANAIRENPSGMSDADKTTHAAANFSAVQKHNFAYMHCWNVMKDEPKWQDPKPRSFPKSGGGENDGIVNLEDDNGIPTGAPEERPMGRDTSKVPKKKANSDASSTSSSEYALRLQDLSLQRIALMQEESVHKKDCFQHLACIDEKRFEEMQSHNQSLLECEQEKIQIMREKHDREKDPCG